MTPNAIVQKLWNYCNILRDDGLSYQDYIEQLTFLLFLKMADERQKLFADRATRSGLAESGAAGRRRFGYALPAHSGGTG